MIPVSQTKTCANCGEEFTIEPEDFDFYEKIKVPAPTWCPECRLKRRMCFRNERSLYRRKCDATGKDIISMYSKDKPFTVYDQKYWWSDNWDPMDYGREYDFNKPFFEQFKKLFQEVPLMSISNMQATNSEYCSWCHQSKNCYLISASLKNEQVLYSNRVLNGKDCSDLYTTHKSELCYEDVYCQNCYKLFFSKHCQNCSDSYFLYDCRNCQNCFGCTNLRNKQYHIFNKPYSKEEYQKKLKEFNLGSYKNFIELKKRFQKFCSKALHRYAHIVKSTNVTGDNIDNSKNCHYCFDITQNAEDCKFCVWAGANLKDTYDGGVGVGDKGELIYEALDSGLTGSRLYFTASVHGSHNIQYAFNCFSSSNLFGCVGLRNKQYCILNKQYTKEEYEQLVPKIIEHMSEMPYKDKQGRVYKYGEFFPPELSPFAYNETIAQEYFPLTKEQALEQGYRWKDLEERNYKVQIPNDKLPDNIKDVSDDIVGKIIECKTYRDNPEQALKQNCTTAFKITPQELDFYRKMGLPLPRYCPNCRHFQRLKQRNPLKLWERQCQCGGEKSTNGVYQNTAEHFHGKQQCPNTFQTTYSPDRPEIVYCKECYQREIV